MPFISKTACAAQASMFIFGAVDGPPPGPPVDGWDDADIFACEEDDDDEGLRAQLRNELAAAALAEAKRTLMCASRVKKSEVACTYYGGGRASSATTLIYSTGPLHRRAVLRRGRRLRRRLSRLASWG